MIQKLALVDDEEVFHWIAKQFISRVDDSIEVLSFYNSKEALDYIKAGNSKPEMLFLDLNMPVSNGWVFLEEYSQMPENGMAVYVCSSSIDPEDHKRAKKFKRVKDFISKPLDMEKLEGILN